MGGIIDLGSLLPRPLNQEDNKNGDSIMTVTRFTGFPEDLFLFLEALSVNNNREWFNANKRRYQQSVVAPVGEFICAMGEHLYRISTNFVADPRGNGGSMFRIYRDTRFSRDKRPYKENVGCHFRHVAGKSAHAPNFTSFYLPS